MFAHRLNQDTELHLLEPRHADELFRLVDANRAHLRPWMPWVDGTRSVEDIRAFCRNGLRELAENGCFEVSIRHRGAIAGVIGVHAIDWVNRRTALGYWLDEAHQGRGLMTTAGRAIISHLFHRLQVNRIEIHAAAGNTRSRAVPERLGFVHEGTHRQDMRIDERCFDREVYAMLREDWPEPPVEIAFSRPLAENAELRLLLPHYAEEMFAVNDANRAYLRPYMQWIDGTTGPEDTRAFIRRALQRMADGTEAHWGVWCEGRFAGTIGTAAPFDFVNKKVEFGYWIAEDLQGRGLVTAASRVMLAYLFDILGLNRAELRIRTVNARSRAVADRLGFSLEGVQRQAVQHDGEAGDMACYGLLREEWEGAICC
jgi:ribosomal-protein-serine acetyltransferase